MYTHTQRRSDKLTQELRAQAGRWLCKLRERRGLSQRTLAQKVGTEYHTFVSQIEQGRGRIPPDSYLVWADALGVEPREFVRTLMSYYDPVTYNIIFAHSAPSPSTPVEDIGGTRTPSNHPFKRFKSAAVAWSRSVAHSVTAITSFLSL
jgi:transcriptional regulator with XRE-family HTH domain